ncbi:hyccin related [Holotrichia oblita]|uniref:Hyccin related n=1 Tax=Holotrichia oblita TaxID=644536 RepID=A0ACB9TG23_HOLOL|nr:hyccin related [Holotrichia oblita]
MPISAEEAIMADILVLEWIEEFDALTESEINTYAIEQENNHEVIIALYVLLEEPQQSKRGSIIEKICKQLLGFYRSGDQYLKKFVMQYIPSLIWLHLSARQIYPEVETLLLSLYNLEVVDNKGQPRIISFRVPSIAQSSIFHDSSNLEPSFIAENSLRRWEECNTKLVNWGPLPQVESLNAQNRQRVATALLFLYNQQISNISIQGIEHSCRAISRLVTQGFHSGSNRTSSDSDSINYMSTVPRLVVSSPLLLELLQVVYHGLERGASGVAQTLHDITARATYETYADDIPIQDNEGESNLNSIVEEGQENAEKVRFRGRSGSALKHLPKLSGLSKKPKTKNSPTPPRHSLESDPPIEMHMAGGDQVSLVSGNFQENGTNEVQGNTAV